MTRKWSDRRSNKKVKFDITLSELEFAQLERLKLKMEVDLYATVMSNALRLYDDVVCQFALSKVLRSVDPLGNEKGFELIPSKSISDATQVIALEIPQVFAVEVSKEKAQQMTLEMPQKSVDRISVIMSQMEIDRNTIFVSALSLLDQVIAGYEAGETFFLKDASEKMEEYEIF